MQKKSMISIGMAMVLTCNIFNPSVVKGAVNYDRKFKEDTLLSSSESRANGWQIMQGGYAGKYDGTSDVSQGFDEKANVSYSDDDAVRLTKNVVSTDVENEFLMYLNIEPQVSWEEVLQLNTLMVTNSNAGVTPPEWPKEGNPSILKPEKDSEYTTPVQVEYYATENGKKIILAKVTMYANTNKVPKGTYAIGNPLLAPAGQSFTGGNNFNLKETGNEGVSTAEIDLTGIYKKYVFAKQKVYPRRVKDQMGAHVLMNETSVSYDGGTYSYTNGELDWTLPTTDLGLLPYKTESDGKITPSGIKRGIQNGKFTYYRERAYQLSYKFSLKVEDEDFISCQSAASSNDINESYAIQTNISPDTPDSKINGGTVTYETDGKKGTGYFKSPYVKGLRYNLEFQKVIEASHIALEGVTFTIERVSGGSTYSEQITKSEIQISGEDGWVKFHDLPWGNYTIKEISYKTGDEFQKQYLEQDLPKTIATVSVGQCINGEILTDDHEGQHSCDQSGDTRNPLFLLQNGTVENKPYRANVTIREIVESYEELSEELKNVEYEVETKSSSLYKKPEDGEEQLQFIEKGNKIAHNETVSYELLVPKEGGILTIEELIPESVKNKIVFKQIDVSENKGSTALGEYQMEGQGCSIKVLPGNDITITITNLPVARVNIKVVIDNYKEELKGDEFIIHAKSVTGEAVDTQVVLKQEEQSADIRLTKKTEIELSQIMPKEYSFSKVDLLGGGELKENNLTVKPGEEVTVIVHDQYKNKPYFHVSNSVTNLFQGK